jgi:SAM-dependent methyltransferase
MPVGEAELQDTWNQVLDRFPFPDYIQIPRGHLEVARTVARLLPPGSRVLDFGAGPADKTVRTTGTRSPTLVRKCWTTPRNMGIDYIPMNGKDIPPTTGEFDMVMSHDVLEYLHDPPHYLFTELMKRVRTGGYL